MKPKLLVVELWGLGDLLIATPFLQAASRQYSVTLLAKPYARDLQARFWPEVAVIPFVAPWTAFTHKYRLLTWPWGGLIRLRRLAAESFDFGLSARWDPRDHLLLMLARGRKRFGFPRLSSQIFLTDPLTRPDPRAHRYEHWRVLAAALGFELVPHEQLVWPALPGGRALLVHTGAGQSVRVWALERYQRLVTSLRARGHPVQVVCDPDQQSWWVTAGERSVATPRTATDLLRLLDHSCAFIGNDSGPGHLAAFCGLPTFTIFGPQLPEWFAPLHPRSEWMEGRPCPYKPCSDYCRFREPLCMDSGFEEVEARVLQFLKNVMSDVSD